jgi:hypothetical protein
MQTLNEHIAKDGFRLRGTAMSRVDGFSDVVFGFAHHATRRFGGGAPHL